MESRTHSAWLALGLAPLGILQVVARQYTGRAAWPYWIDDIVIAVGLGIAGLLVLRETTSTRARALSAAWGAMLVVLWSSTFRHLDNVPLEADAPHLTIMTIGMTGLIILAALGLVLSLPTTKRPFIGTRPPKEKKKGWF
ncbi:hypothetical protein GVN21_14965 [Caulobacter sp. SLTY]|uniref:hypothetical protein n=1 Tax=Caulobacter sp. SLTY TaxID=2683262 RepID=UPI001411C3C6|nr:hypothetical protein [Caulobacter sp. SLTY]NBB16663.1 hypothetical protein [Caulobacter sp. SLTY]